LSNVTEVHFFVAKVPATNPPPAGIIPSETQDPFFLQATKMKCCSFAGAILAVGMSVLACSAAAVRAQAAVSITDSGRDVVLSNGLVTATIAPASAEITSIKYKGHEMVSASGGHRNIYFSRDGGTGYENLPHCVGRIVTQTDDTIDYACKHTYDPSRGDKHAWDVDVHFVVRRGVPGVYVYTINSHPASYPDMSVGEWRMVWSPPENSADQLEKIYIDEARHWVVPTAADFRSARPVPGAPKEVSLMTTGTWQGRMDCKYMYAASYWQIRCWGFASDQKHLGEWVLLPSCEFCNDGPNKQDLTAAVGTTLLHLNMNHYDGTGFAIRSGRDWTKFYGPWLLYFNDKETADECWHDAQEQTQLQAAQWPFNWVKNVNYPLAAERGTVKGKLVLHDALKPQLTAAGAWVGLSGPADRPDADFQFEASGYQFWTHANEDGAFDLKNVRPGTYTLYAYTTGVIGQFQKADIVVRAGATKDLGALAWTAPHAGDRIAWEIGVPDRSAAEFAHGKDYYLPLMYQKLAEEVPNPLDFTIGKSDPATDWYYAQAPHGRGNPSVWRIHFNLDRAPASAATLILAFAGADRARLNVGVNGESVGQVIPPVQGGNGLVREAVHTKYSVSSVSIPPGRLHAGENVISLTLGSGSDAGYVMYDYLSLEMR
jgi:rhamnogalacturonan endolyase